MSFTGRAAFDLVPLLSRLVLAAALIPAGWNKIMGEPVVYTGTNAALLREMGVGEPAANPGRHQANVYGDGAPGGRLSDRIRPRKPQPAEPVAPLPPPRPQPTPPPPPDIDPPDESDAEPQPEDVEPAEAEAQEEPKLPQPPSPPPPQPPPVAKRPQPVVIAANDPRPVRARPLYGVALTLVNHSPWTASLKPDWMAWAAAGTELAGGTLILIGILARVWGVCLAVAMLGAFYVTTLGALCDHGVLSLPPDVLNRAFAQVGLFVFAAGVAMTGAGKLSLDGLVFRRGVEDDESLLQLG